MTQINHTTLATDLADEATNRQLAQQGYTIRHIETWIRDTHSDSIIIWDCPELPY